MRTTTAVLATVGILLALTSCSSDTADPKACKAAMATAFDNGDQQDKRPAACDGVDDKTLQRIAAELITDHADDAADDALESAAPDATTGPVSAECRAWIEAELLDSSDAIDGTTGNGVCGDLTDTEMDQAIEDVTNSLLATPTP